MMACLAQSTRMKLCLMQLHRDQVSDWSYRRSSVQQELKAWSIQAEGKSWEWASNCLGTRKKKEEPKRLDPAEPQEEDKQEQEAPIEQTPSEKPPMAEKQSRSDKRSMIQKLRNQNDKLKQELWVLTVKLEDFVENAKQKRTNKSDLWNATADMDEEEQQIIKEKESKLKKA